MPPQTPSDVELLEALRGLHPGLTSLWIFGSRCRGDHGPQSDLDLAALWAISPPPLQHFEMANALSDRWGIEVDLVDFAYAPCPLQASILCNGREIFQNTDGFVREIALRSEITAWRERTAVDRAEALQRMLKSDQ